MTITTITRQSTDDETVKEMDRRGAVIENLEARIAVLEAALKPFADFFPKVDQFIEGTVRFGGSPIMPTRAFTRADFQRASAALQLKEPS